VTLTPLANPIVWSVSRRLLDLTFGLYRRRIAILGEWGALNANASMLDIGCGTGTYSTIATGRYVGIDLEEKYVDYARRRHGSALRSFRRIDARELARESETFDVVLLVDFLHHLDDASCVHVLEAASTLARFHLVSFEPVTEQRNRIGRWFIEHDRGDHMRSLGELNAVYERTPFDVADQRPLQLGPIATVATLLNVRNESVAPPV
jgi:SAM-dependent methyltransferase